VELNVIKSWLGHVSVTTTSEYIEIDMAMKRKAIERCTPPVPEPTGDSPWRREYSDTTASAEEASNRSSLDSADLVLPTRHFYLAGLPTFLLRIDTIVSLNTYPLAKAAELSSVS
jgi:hypothetical protein